MEEHKVRGETGNIQRTNVPLLSPAIKSLHVLLQQTIRGRTVSAFRRRFHSLASSCTIIVGTIRDVSSSFKWSEIVRIESFSSVATCQPRVPLKAMQPEVEGEESCSKMVMSFFLEVCCLSLLLLVL